MDKCSQKSFMEMDPVQSPASKAAMENIPFFEKNFNHGSWAAGPQLSRWLQAGWPTFQTLNKMLVLSIAFHICRQGFNKCCRFCGDMIM